MKHALASLCVIALAAASSAQAGLIHRWSFSETGGAGTILADSIGGANASIVDVGTNDGTVGGGQVTLTGGARASSDYVALPNNLLSPLTDATVEVWATQISVQNWSRIFDFGSDTTNNLLMSWTQGTNLATDRMGFKITTEVYVNNAMQPYTLGQQFHIVMTVADTGGPSGQTQIKLYRDGALRGTLNTSYDLNALVETANYIGRSQYNDSTANASWNEFRIYNNVLLPFEQGESRLVGPDHLNSTMVSRFNALSSKLYQTVPLPSLNFNDPALMPNGVPLTGVQVLGGVPFDLVNVNGNNGWNAYSVAGAYRSLTIPVNPQAQVLAVDLLLGTYWGEQVAGPYASLLFAATDGSTFLVPLDGNSELRDYQTGSFANQINGITTTQAYTRPDNVNMRVDMTRVVIPDDWWGKTLSSVTVQDFYDTTHTGSDGFQRVFIVGMTLEMIPEPATLTILALGGLGLLRRRRRR